MNQPLLKCEKIGFRSMFDVNFSLFESDLLMIIGLRGSYLHELFNILSGNEQKYCGRLCLDGNPVTFISPTDANNHGIYVIQNSSAIIENFKLSENIFLAPHPVKAPFFLCRTNLDSAADELLQCMELPLQGNMYGGACDTFERHAVMAARAVAHGAKIIIFENTMDNYTDVQIRRFKGLLKILQEKGIGVVVFSGVITSIFEQANQILVLRDATVAHVFEKGEVNKSLLFQALTQGQYPSATYKDSEAEQPPVLIQLRGFRPGGYMGASLNLSVPRSDIVSLIADDVTNSSLILESIFGLNPFKGEMILNASPCRFISCSDAIAAGIGMVYGEPDKNLFTNFKAEENVSLMLGKHTDHVGGFTNRSINQYLASKAAEKYGISQDVLDIADVEELSNIQKISLALLRWLVLKPKLLLMIHPYCSLDEVERLELNKLLLQIASSGISILLLSPFVSDIIQVSSRTIEI